MTQPLAFPGNTTCDIYRAGNNPPAAPDVAGVSIFLAPDFGRSHASALVTNTLYRWTHYALMPLSADIRDDYQGLPNSLGSPTNEDAVYIPDKNGVKYLTIFIERINRGTAQDCLRVYLQRQHPTWPTNQL